VKGNKTLVDAAMQFTDQAAPDSCEFLAPLKSNVAVINFASWFLWRISSKESLQILAMSQALCPHIFPKIWKNIWTECFR
jgi:hypothetical protein